jgi:hypothetical protein
MRKHLYFTEDFHMMTDAERRLMTDLELLYDDWAREWLCRVRDNTQPTREDERRHLMGLKKVISDHWGIDMRTGEGYLK